MSTDAGDNAMGVEAVGVTADRHGNDTEAGAHMGCDDVGEEGGVTEASPPNPLRKA